ncbi:MAG: hypothetical protein J7M21_04180, partial [Planctomycetes bacterium]|nr:hypothetical protein [Planctomycetota bacterium]
AAALALAAAGCDRLGMTSTNPQVAQTSPAASQCGRNTNTKAQAAQAEFMADTAVRGDQATDGQGAVDVALEWSKKYAQAAEQLLAAQKENKQLREDNKKLLAQVAKLQIQLEQSQSELDQANEMLVEMGKQLREWKTNVMGFRQEMQQAQQVQMEALKKILLLLSPGGAETEPTSSESAVSAKDNQDDGTKSGPNS